MYTEKFIADIPNPYGYVYVTTNLVTGKRYCGKHKSSKYDPNYLGSGVLLKQAINQYGADYFKSAPIEWAISAEEMDSAGNIKASKRKSIEKIDDVVTLIMTLDRAIRIGNVSTESVYEVPNYE